MIMPSIAGNLEFLRVELIKGVIGRLGAMFISFLSLDETLGLRVVYNLCFPYTIIYLSSATPLSLFSDRISHYWQQFKVYSNTWH